jgi:TrpR family trp operon transcriptional repressor
VGKKNLPPDKVTVARPEDLLGKKNFHKFGVGDLTFFVAWCILYGMNRDDPLVTENINELCGLLAKINDADTMRRVFRDMFTPSEIADFAARWLLVKELAAKTRQRIIATQYNLSLCKITRGAKELKKEDSAFRLLLDMLKKEKN